jgi:cellulose synthase operon protein C
LSAGFQDITESRTPWFPLGNSTAGYFPGDHRFGEAFDFELKGVWLINPNFQLGAGAAIRKTSGYEDYTGGLFVRYYFNGRKVSFSTDIPGNMFSSMY